MLSGVYVVLLAGLSVSSAANTSSHSVAWVVLYLMGLAWGFYGLELASRHVEARNAQTDPHTRPRMLRERRDRCGRQGEWKPNSTRQPATTAHCPASSAFLVFGLIAWQQSCRMPWIWMVALMWRKRSVGASNSVRCSGRWGICPRSGDSIAGNGCGAEQAGSSVALHADGLFDPLRSGLHYRSPAIRDEPEREDIIPAGGATIHPRR